MIILFLLLPVLDPWSTAHFTQNVQLIDQLFMTKKLAYIYISAIVSRLTSSSTYEFKTTFPYITDENFHCSKKLLYL